MPVRSAAIPLLDFPRVPFLGGLGNALPWPFLGAALEAYGRLLDLSVDNF